MAQDGKKILSKKDGLKNPSKAFRAALAAVKNMKDIYNEPLPGRTPSKAFMNALAALKKLAGKRRSE